MEELNPNQVPKTAQDHIRAIDNELILYWDDIIDYLDVQEGRIFGTEAHEILDEAARLINYGGLVPPEREPVAVNDAFYRGGLLGWRLVEELLGGGYSERIAEYPIDLIEPTEGFTSELERYQALARSIWELGGHGYDRASAYHTWLESLEDQIAPEGADHHYLQHGFGFVLQLAYRLEDQAAQRESKEDLARMQGEADENVDWDRVIADIYKKESR
ncbi:MAG: hypothetical protein WD467_00620 [Candidatus Saccharimonadales bacterium]